MASIDKIITAQAENFNYDNFDASGLTRYAPVPETESSSGFDSVMNTVGDALSTAGNVAGSVFGIQSEFQDMIGLQIYWQQQMQKVTFTSNIIKSEHETKMSAIRNVRTA